MSTKGFSLLVRWFLYTESGPTGPWQQTGTKIGSELQPVATSRTSISRMNAFHRVLHEDYVTSVDKIVLRLNIHTVRQTWIGAMTITAFISRMIRKIFDDCWWVRHFVLVSELQRVTWYQTSYNIQATRETVCQSPLQGNIRAQATVLDARASRVKWPAQFMSHWYGILFTE